MQKRDKNQISENKNNTKTLGLQQAECGFLIFLLAEAWTHSGERLDVLRVSALKH